MNRLAILVGVGLALGAWASSISAEPRHNPPHGSPKGAPAHGGHGMPVPRGHFGHRFGIAPPRVNVFYGSYGPSISPSYGYAYGYGYGGYPYYPYYGGSSSYMGPLYIPFEQLYDPGLIRRMVGLPPYSLPGNNTNIIVVPRAGLANGIGPVPSAVPFQAAGAPDDPPLERGTNAESVALAGRILATGDEYFQNQKFASAYQRYTSATKVAPQMADAYVRQGLSLVALGRYEQAVRVIKRAIEVDPGLSQGGFRLDTLYGPNRMAKQAHLDALATAAADQPGDPDLLFLLGVLLHFDGQIDRAKPFFQRAAQLAGNNQGHLAGFLN